MKILLSAISFLCLLTGFAQKHEKAEVIIQSGHYDEVQGLAFSPDGKILVSVGKDNKAIMWDIRTGKEFRTLRGHENGILSVLFTPDGKKIITGGDSRDQAIRIYDRETGKELLEIEKANSNSIGAMAITKDGKYLASATYRELKMWDVNTGKMIYELEDDRNAEDLQRIRHTVEYITFSPDNQLMAFSVYGGIIHIRNTMTGAYVKSMNAKDHQGMVGTLAFSPDGKKLYSSGPMGNMIIWDVMSGKALEFFEHLGGGTPCPCSFSPDLKYFYNSCGSDPTKFDIENKTEVYELKDFMYQTNTLALDPSGKLLAVGGRDKNDNESIMILNAENGVILKRLEGFPGAITSLDFNSDGTRILSGSADRFARSWDLTTSAGFVNYSEGTYSQGDIYASVRYALSDDKVIMAAQNTSFAWDATTAKYLGPRIGTGAKQRDNIEVTPDGKYFITTPGKIIVHDAQTHERVHELDRPNLMLRSITMSDDGTYLFAGGHKEIKRWKIKEGFVEDGSFEASGYSWRMSVSVDNKHLASVEFSEVFIRDAQSGAVIKKLTQKADQVRYSPDGKFLATAYKGHIIIWNAADYTMKYTLEGHHDAINTLAFTPDARLLASGSDDTSIILWSMQDGSHVARLIALKNENFIIITPDNYYMTSKGGIDGVVFRQGNKLYPFEQFDLHYNRPDIVLERLGFASEDVIKSYKAAYKKRLKKMGFNEDRMNKEFHAPNLILNNRNNMSLSTPSRSIPLDIHASDDKYTIDRINVWINDVPVFGTKGIDLSSSGKNQIREKVDLELAEGVNKVQVSVHNSNGVESLREAFEIMHRDPSRNKKKPNLYVLAIGDSEFKSSEYNLNYAAKDVNDFATLLKGADEVFGEVMVKEILNKDVTRENILSAKSFLEASGRNDAVIVFIAGHGVLDADFDYYFATYNMDFENPSAQGIVYDDIESLLDGLKSIKKLLFMDTCHSGEVDKEEVELASADIQEEDDIVFRAVGPPIKSKDNLGLKSSSSLVKEIFTDVRRGTGATVISSAGGAEYAMESDKWKNGLFTYCLLNGLTSGDADLDDNGEIMLSEIQAFVKDQVNRLSQGRQVPTSRIENISLDYRLW